MFKNLQVATILVLNALGTYVVAATHLPQGHVSLGPVSDPFAALQANCVCQTQVGSLATLSYFSPEESSATQSYEGCRAATDRYIQMGRLDPGAQVTRCTFFNKGTVSHSGGFTWIPVPNHLDSKCVCQTRERVSGRISGEVSLNTTQEACQASAAQRRTQNPAGFMNCIWVNYTAQPATNKSFSQ